jgi:hypothetical protein
MHEYKITAFDEIEFLKFVQEQKFEGYCHPNMPGGMLFVLKMDDETALSIKLKFRCKIFGKSQESDS